MRFIYWVRTKTRLSNLPLNSNLPLRPRGSAGTRGMALWDLEALSESERARRSTSPSDLHRARRCGGRQACARLGNGAPNKRDYRPKGRAPHTEALSNFSVFQKYVKKNEHVLKSRRSKLHPKYNGYRTHVNKKTTLRNTRDHDGSFWEDDSH